MDATQFDIGKKENAVQFTANAQQAIAFSVGGEDSSASAATGEPQSIQFDVGAKENAIQFSADARPTVAFSIWDGRPAVAAPADVDMRAEDGYIQFRSNDGDWENIIALEELKGDPGEPGYTPVKGVDYFTEADKQEIAEAAAEIVEESGGGQASSVLAKDVYFENDLVLTEPFGRYKLTDGQVTVPAENRSLYDVFMDAMSEDKNPNTTQPGVGVSSGTAKAYEVGTEVAPAYSGTFSAGAYSYDKTTGVSVTAWEASNSVTAEKLSTQSGQFAKYTVTDSGRYTITVKATYTDGSIPHTVLGAEYPAGQIKGGTKQATTGAITGFRNSFYGTLTDKGTVLNSAAIRNFAQKAGKALANGSSFTVNVPVGAMAVVIAYPATLRALSSVKDVNGMNAEIVSAFAASNADVEGANGYEAIGYRVYVQQLASANDTANTYKVTI